MGTEDSAATPCGNGFCFLRAVSSSPKLPLLAQATATFCTTCPEKGDMEQMARVVLHVFGLLGEKRPAGRKGCDSCKRHDFKKQPCSGVT